MSKFTRVRNRGVRLTDEGVCLVQDRLATKWSQEGTVGKLTRERKALLLGLSIATADRVLKGATVDRATLMFVFDRLGLVWEEKFLDNDKIEDVSSVSEIEITDCIEGNQPRFMQAICLETPHSPPSDSSDVPSRANGSRLSALAASLIILPIFLIIAMGRGKRGATGYDPFLEGQKAFHKGDYTGASVIAVELRSQAKQKDSAGELAASLRLDGDVNVARGEYALALRDFEHALQIREELEQTATYAALWEVIGDCQLHLGQYAKAEASFRRSRQQFAQMRDRTGIVMASRGLASVRTAVGDLTGAMKWIRECEKLLDLQSESKSLQDMQADVLSRKAILLAKAGKYDNSLEMLELCLAHWKKKGHLRWIASTEARYGFVLRLSGQQKNAEEKLASAKQHFAHLGDNHTLGLVEAEILPGPGSRK